MPCSRYSIAITLGLLAGSSSSARAQAPADFGHAAQLYGAQKYDSAALLLRSIVSSDSTNARAWSLLGASLQGDHKLGDAVVVYRKALQFDIVRPTVLYNLGLALGQLGSVDSAFVYLQQAKATGRANLADIDLDPDAAGLRTDPRYALLKPSAAELAQPFAEPSRIIRDWHGEGVNDVFGWIARDIGDVDADGVHDVVTSAPFQNSGAGAVYVYSARSGKELWHVKGNAGERLGIGVEAAGDVNGDGIPDVTASAPGIEKAFVYSGKDGTVLLTVTGESAGENFGKQVSGTGDVDRDGYADIIVGAPAANANAGAAYIFSGKTGKLLFKLKGSAGARFGSAVTGWASGKRMLIVVGAPGAGPVHKGVTYVFNALDSLPAFSLTADSTGGALGAMFVSIAGDANHDGVPEVFVSDWPNNARGRSTGRVYLLSGADGKVLLTLTGETAGDGFGTSASKAGDIDGDGYADLAIGAWQHASKAISGGKIYLYSGKDGHLIRTWTGQVPGETLGFDAVGIGDVDGDGRNDLLVTSAYSSVAGSHSGRVLIIAGPGNMRGKQEGN
jgi:hypothetical protein